jgi:hypothetical protein
MSGIQTTKLGRAPAIYAATVLFSITLSRRSFNAASATAGRERSPPQREDLRIWAAYPPGIRRPLTITV